MTITMQYPRSQAKLLRNTRSTHTYFGIDGGAGANLLADLAGCDPSLRAVASPRHADLLLIVEPVSQKLVPSILAIAKSLPTPARIILFKMPEVDLPTFAGTEIVPLERIFPEADRVSSLEQLLSAAWDTKERSRLVIAENAGKEQEPTTIQLPQKSEQEMATELVVVSLGPIQPFTAGPLRLLLVCDGEQVLSAQVEAGYAHRGIDEAMQQATWLQGLKLARLLDPLAPLAGQLAYVQAIERLQGWQPSQAMADYRNIVVALERVQNTLWWCVRLAHHLTYEPLLTRSSTLARTLSAFSATLWQHSPQEWLLPQNEETVLAEKNSLPQNVLSKMEQLMTYVKHNRSLALRTHNIGKIKATQLHEAGISTGFVLEASEPGIQGSKGDIQSRLVTRAQSAQRDIQTIADMLTASPIVSAPHEANWTVLAGETYTTVRGPRGDIGLHLRSDGKDSSTQVLWQRPSAALLSLLPTLLEGQKLADVELLVASLDLSMAEVDG